MYFLKHLSINIFKYNFEPRLNYKNIGFKLRYIKNKSDKRATIILNFKKVLPNYYIHNHLKFDILSFFNKIILDDEFFRKWND